jgi:carboxymethylenebutenolidase
MRTVQSQVITTEVAGRSLTGYLAKSDIPGPGIVLLHAWWGLNDFFKQTCDRLAGEGFHVFAPDLNDGQIAATIEEAERLMETRDAEKDKTTALNAFDWAREQFGAPLGLVGFSMGGYWSMQLASLRPESVRAVVLFYDAPDAELNIQASFLGHYGGTDDWTPMEYVDGLELALREAGLPVEFHRYPEAGHWFVETDRSVAYRPDDTALAWERTVAFLQRELSA